MSGENPRRVVEPSAPPMTDEEFQAQLGRHAEVLEGLKSPEKKRKTSMHPDIARAVARVEAAYRKAYEAMGSNNAEMYHHTLIALRQAIGTWGTIDGQHGDVSWRPTAK